MSDHHALGRTATSQHGLLTVSQGKLLGVGRGAAQYRRRSGIYEHRSRGVDAIAGTVRTWEQDAAAAQLAVGALAAVSHRSASRVWGLGTFDAPIEVTAPYERSPEVAGVIVHRSGDLDPAHVERVGDLFVTGVARTLVDVGAVLPGFLVERLVERACGRGLTTPTDLATILMTLGKKGRRGAGVLRRVLAGRVEISARQESELEERFVSILRDHGLPIPQAQYGVTVGGHSYRLDFAYPEAMVAIEIDGFSSHSSRTAFERDRTRQNELVLVGWRVVRFTSEQLLRAPLDVAATTASLL